jgi:hypothetical protein
MEIRAKILNWLTRARAKLEIRQRQLALEKKVKKNKKNV